MIKSINFIVLTQFFPFNELSQVTSFFKLDQQHFFLQCMFTVIYR